MLDGSCWEKEQALDVVHRDADFTKFGGAPLYTTQFSVRFSAPNFGVTGCRPRYSPVSLSPSQGDDEGVICRFAVQSPLNFPPYHRKAEVCTAHVTEPFRFDPSRVPALVRGCSGQCKFTKSPNPPRVSRRAYMLENQSAAVVISCRCEAGANYERGLGGGGEKDLGSKVVGGRGDDQPMAIMRPLCAVTRSILSLSKDKKKRRTQLTPSTWGNQGRGSLLFTWPTWTLQHMVWNHWIVMFGSAIRGIAFGKWLSPAGRKGASSIKHFPRFRSRFAFFALLPSPRGTAWQ
ncbi:hypothetical protein BC827DRAFT_1382854 [Russula dissimulans]|nr:hypothetical protein BC827DRAFT_1382854 [Russula dissimulans]